MAKCTFCSKQIEQGKGLIFVDMDKIYNFCSSKCMKNLRLGRDSSKVAWVRKSGRKKTKAELKAELLEEAKHETEEKGKEAKPEEKKKEAEKPEEKQKEEKKQEEPKK